MTRAELHARLDSYAGFLAEEFPTDAFTAASLRHIARDCPYWPSYGQLCASLSAWWRDNRPMPPALAAPPPAPPAPPREAPTPEESAAVHGLVQQFIATVRSPFAEPREDEPLGVKPQHLPPAVLDQINPLPNGRKRA